MRRTAGVDATTRRDLLAEQGSDDILDATGS